MARIAFATALRHQIAELNTRFTRHADASLLHKEAELYKLRSQMQPHFLYNSLNSINALITINPLKAQEMVGTLATYMRNTVKADTEACISINNELEHLTNYIAIETTRFGNRLNVVVNNTAPQEAQIPPLLLQPLIENAIKFGLYSTQSHVEVAITVEQKGEYPYIIITNPFSKEEDAPMGTGFGLKGITRRLQLLYNRTDLLQTHQTTTHFTATLIIPQANV